MGRNETIEAPPGFDTEIEAPPGFDIEISEPEPVKGPPGFFDMGEPPTELSNVYKVADTMPDPPTEKKKIENSLILAQVMDQKPSTVYDNHDEIIKQMKELDEQTPNIGPVEAIFKSFVQSLAAKPAMILRGKTAWSPGEGIPVFNPFAMRVEKSDKALLDAANYLESLRNPKAKEEVQKALNYPLWPVHPGDKWTDIDPKMIPKVITAWAAQVGDQIPIMLITQGSRATNKIIGSLVGTAVGEGIATPAIAKAVSKTIEIVGTAKPLIELEAGNFLDSIAPYEIDADIAEKYTRLYSLGAGTIEYSQQMFMLAPFNKMGTAVKKKIIGRVLTEIGGNAVEGLEEYTQQALQNFFTNKAIDEMKEKHPDFKAEHVAITAGAGQSFLAAAGVSAITRGFGHISGTIYNKFSADEKKQVDIAGVKPIAMAQKEAAKSYTEQTEKYAKPVKPEEITNFKKEVVIKYPALNKPTQPKVKTQEDLYTQANEVKKESENDTREMAKELGGEAIFREGLKKEERTAEKIDKKYKGDASRVTDIIADTVAIDKAIPEDLISKYYKISDDPNIVHIEERISEQGADGYRDIAINKRMSNGHIAETQLTTKALYTAREIIGHGIYKITRAMDQIIQNEKLNTEDAKSLNDFIYTFHAVSKKLYDGAAQVRTVEEAKRIASSSEILIPLARTIADVLESRITSRLPSGKSLQILNESLSSTQASLSNLKNLSSIEQPPSTTIIPSAEKAVKVKKEQPYLVERQELAKKIEDVKLRNAVQLGKAKIGDFIGKEKAAEVSGKKIEEAARKGVVVGKEIGTKKEKVRKAELEARAKEKKAIRTYIAKLAEHISKEPGKSIDFYYRDAIETIQSGIDPSFRTERTLQKRERIRQFLKEHPERVEDMPKKILQTIEKKSMNEMSLSELEEIAEEVEHLRKQGKLKQQIKDNQYKKRIGTDVREMTSEVLSGEEISKEPQPIVASTTKEGRLKKAPRFVRAFTLRPTRIFHKIFGGDKTTGYKRFVDDENKAVDQELRETDKRTETVKKKMADLDITSRDLAKTRKIDGTKYTVDEMIDIYAGFKNPLKEIAIIYGNKINEKTAEKIINNLTEKEKAFADFIIKEYEGRYSELRKAHIEFRNEDLGHEENYTPIRRQEIEYKTLDAELADELLHKTHLKKAYTERGFTKARVKIPKEFQKPIRLGLYATWLDQAPKQEHYISHTQLIKELQAISHNDTFQEAIKQKYGNEYLERIHNYVDRVADPLIYRSFHGPENVSRFLRQHTAVAYLAYNLVTMAKQLPSVMLYLPHSGPTHLIGAALRFSTNPFKMIREVNEKDPQMKHRSIERELEEFKQMNKPGYERMLKKIGKTGMVGIYAMDKVATTIGWYATYSKNLQMGKSESVAVRAAQKATLETQPAAHVKDVAELYATSEYVNLFTQFSNQLNQIYNISTYDIPKYFKEHKYYKALLATTGLASSALIIWTISHRRLPEKPEDLKDAALEQAINMIPLVGRQFAAAKSGWMSTAPPVFKPVEAIGKAMSDSSKKAKINAMVEGGAIAMGIPYTGPKRIIKAITKEKPEELIGGKPRR